MDRFRPASCWISCLELDRARRPPPHLAQSLCNGLRSFLSHEALPYCFVPRQPMNHVVSNKAHCTIVGPTVETAGAAARRTLIADQSRVLRHLVAALGCHEEAREVWQRFALKVLTQGDTLRDVAAVYGWMSQVLRTTVADHRRTLARARKRETPLDKIDADDSVLAFQPDTPFMEAACECLHKHLPLLRPDYAEIVRRADLQSESREDIAASLQTTVNNIGVRLHRGRKALRQRLEDGCLACEKAMHVGCGCPELEGLPMRKKARAAVDASAQC